MLRLPALALLLLMPAALCGGQAPRTLTLAFIGDIMAHGVNYRVRDFHEIYRGVEDALSSSDLVFANLEFPVVAGKPVSDYPAFNSTRAYWQAAVDAGIRVFSLANNHAFDLGREGVMETLRSAAAVRTPSGQPVYVSGIRVDPSRAFQPVTMEARGVRVGFLAVTEFLNQGRPSPYVNVADYRDAASADALVSAVRRMSRGCDLFVLSYHGDSEYSMAASMEKARFFRRLLAAGAHIVFGHHPHVFQGYQVIRVGGETRLSLLSMGNFISGMTWNADPRNSTAVDPATGESALLRVEVLFGPGGTSIRAVQALPISNYRNARGEMVVGKLAELASDGPGLGEAWAAYFRDRLAVLGRRMGPQEEAP
jgi:poly-gamma-glutamate capsule biosynthesis protein CapA/YwtB (metallophosphatase superfamily)